MAIQTLPRSSRLPRPQPRHLLVGLLAAGIVAAVSLPQGLTGQGLTGHDLTGQGLTGQGRIVLAVSGLAILGWVGTRIPESLVALGAVLALVLGGALSEAQLFAALGSELVWLLIAAIVIAAVARDSGLTQRLVAPLLARGMRVAPFFLCLTLAIAATAFLLPSTSGRAALLLPVFAALAGALPDARLRLALALLFPTVILLSAGASLIGAGAHLLAAQAIREATGLRLGYLDWAALGLPFSLLASLTGAALILALFVPRADWMTPLPSVTLPAPEPAQAARQRRIGLVLLGVLGMWTTTGLHGMGMAMVALGGALILLTPPFSSRKPKDIFRAVDTELLLYMTATMLIAQAMTTAGTDRWLAGLALSALPGGLAGNLAAVAVLLSLVAVTAHLAITSRSARAAVLIPAVALPLAALGHDPALMILIAVMGTGFCQSMMASAKPVAIFGAAEEAGFTQADLIRLALPLAPAVTALLIGFSLLVWPAQLDRMQAATPVPEPVAQPAAAAQTAVPSPVPVPVVAAAVANAPMTPVSVERPLPRPLPQPVGLTAPAPRKAVRAVRRTPAVSRRGTDPALRHLNRILRPAGIRLVIR
ncbi:SLC13 family permease [uncultured Paracoccus sp.]|uniref:SLC13 family permease n=1 Tax=uncultured Paracoccus sp. TaxID=189685 RepID=UPI0025F26C8E|nr:SLC13 family permease [uncultured Paracoccus sp.]